MRVKGAPEASSPYGRLEILTELSSDAERRRLDRVVKSGQALRLSPGIYVVGATLPINPIVRHYLYDIASTNWPGGVFFGKSSISASIHENGEIYIAHPSPKRKSPLVIGGFSFIPEIGPGPLPGDAALPCGMAISGQARRLVENVNLRGYPPRSRAGTMVVEDRIDEVMRTGGPERVRQILDELEIISTHFDPRAVEIVKRTLVAVIGTVSGRLTPTSPRLTARLSGTPYDASRIESLDALVEMLDATSFTPRPTFSPKERWEWLPFYEAYFSNFIEGTEFDIDEAYRIAIDGHVPTARPADAHDITAAFLLTSDPKDRTRIPTNGEELLLILRERHARLMAARPEITPGLFKTVANRAGTYYFVAPELVVGTLLKGFDALSVLVNPMARSVAMMALVTECHPFLDGNGRIARMMANSELSAKDEVRIVIPSISRDDYVLSLNAYSDPAVGGRALFAFMENAQKWTSRIDWSDYATARATLEACNAFEDSRIASKKALRLEFPR